MATEQVHPHKADQSRLMTVTASAITSVGSFPTLVPFPPELVPAAPLIAAFETQLSHRAAEGNMWCTFVLKGAANLWLPELTPTTLLSLKSLPTFQWSVCARVCVLSVVVIN